MRKILLSFILLCFFSCFIVKAQVEPQKALAVFPFVSKLKTDTKGEDKASELKSFVSEVFSKKPRFNFIDRESGKDVFSELKNQSSELFMQSPILADQLKQWGASHVLTGYLNNATGSISTTSYMGIKQTSLNSNVSFDLIISDVATGKTLSRKSFKVTGSEDVGVSTGNFNVAGGSNPNDVAVSIAKNNIQKAVETWTKDLFIPPLKFLKVSEADEKSGVAKKLLMKGGEEGTLIKGDKIVVNSIELLEGNKMTKKIGMVEVIENLGQVIEVKIKDGAPKIDNALKTNSSIEFLKYIPESK